VRRRDEFSAALGGARARAHCLVIHRAAAPSDGPPKVGFIVGRAVGPAVVRNRTRRQLRHLTQPLLEQLPPGSVVVVRALAGSAGRDSAALSADLTDACRRLDLLGVSG
jgi:ribonuclease P protein component